MPRMKQLKPVRRTQVSLEAEDVTRIHALAVKFGLDSEAAVVRYAIRHAAKQLTVQELEDARTTQ
jgi:hypothetical protein